MKAKLDSAITAIFLICAFVTTGAIVHREFFAVPAGRMRAEQNPIFFKGTGELILRPEHAWVRLMRRCSS